MHLSGRLAACGKESSICYELVCSSSCCPLDTIPLHWRAHLLWRFYDPFRLSLPTWFWILSLMWDCILFFHEPCIKHIFCYFNFCWLPTKKILLQVQILETAFSVQWYLRFTREWDFIFWFSDLWHCRLGIAVLTVQITQKKDRTGDCEMFVSKNTARHHTKTAI